MFLSQYYLLVTVIRIQFLCSQICLYIHIFFTIYRRWWSKIKQKRTAHNAACHFKEACRRFSSPGLYNVKCGNYCELRGWKCEKMAVFNTRHFPRILRNAWKWLTANIWTENQIWYVRNTMQTFPVSTEIFGPFVITFR